MVDSLAAKTAQYEEAKQAYADAKDARYAVEQKIYAFKKNAAFYKKTDVFTQAKLEGDLKTVERNLFFTDCDMNFKGQQKIDECLYQRMMNAC